MVTTQKDFTCVIWTVSVCVMIVVFLGIPSNGVKHSFTWVGVTVCWESLFCSHSFTLISLLTRHIYVTIGHPGQSALLSSPYDISAWSAQFDDVVDVAGVNGSVNAAHMHADACQPNE